MQISVVIPTCNRKTRLLSLLQHLDQSTYAFHEIIIVDSGEELLTTGDYNIFKNLNIVYLQSDKSVCIQRNTGIRQAASPWIFICDDDIEVPPDYIEKLMNHARQHAEAGAISGVVLQKEKDQWVGNYPLTSPRVLLWNYVFQLSIWGEINCRSNSFIIKRVIGYYKRKGNHISKAGWPVITDFTGDYMITPIYGLGASVIKKDWLLASPYDEVLDRHGIGDNYGVAVGFPEPCIHIVNNAFVYHHQEPVNRLKKPILYYRRSLALHYFIKIKPRLQHIKGYRLVWSFIGSAVGFMWKRDWIMVKPALKSIRKVLFNQNPYYRARATNKKTIEPLL